MIDSPTTREKRTTFTGMSHTGGSKTSSINSNFQPGMLINNVKVAATSTINQSDSSDEEDVGELNDELSTMNPSKISSNVRATKAPSS